jgi:hypothetical protein
MAQTCGVEGAGRCGRQRHAAAQPARQRAGPAGSLRAALQRSAYRAAYYSNEAGKENRILGRSNLLPQVSASYGFSQNRTTLTEGRRPGR